VTDRLTLTALQAMKRDGRKIAGVVAWDTPTSEILDRAGVDIVSVGDSVAVNLWGRAEEGDVTLEEMLLLCAAVRRGVRRAVVSCDLPARIADVDAARRLVAEGGADVVKVDRSDAVGGLVGAGVPVFAQLSGTGGDAVAEAKRLEAAGASLLDFRHSGPVAGPKVVEAVSIPVLGGLGGGPWLDGRIRLLGRLVDVSPAVGEAAAGYVDDVRAGRAVKGD
jgi:3-methyl-2-oxobutanoate hydroxymethyltransferase